MLCNDEGADVPPYQLKFIKQLYEGRWDERMKALQKGIDLRLNGSCHSKFGNKLDILRLLKKKKFL